MKRDRVYIDHSKLMEQIKKIGIYQAVLTALQENAKGLHDHLFEVK